MFAAAAGAQTAPVDFGREIAPLLVARCVTCHQPEKSKGGYQLHTLAALKTPGRSKDAPIVAGRPGDSLLVRLLQESDPEERMPQKGDPLTTSEIALIRRWIEQGAHSGGLDPNKLLSTLAGEIPQPAPPEHYPRPVPIFALAFTPDGLALAAGGYHEVVIWDSASGLRKQRIQNVAQQVQQIAFRPGGQELAVAAGTPGRLGEVKLFEFNSGRFLRSLAMAGDLMTTVAFHPDGQRVAVGGADNAIRLVEISGAQRYRNELIADWVMQLAFRSDGEQLVLAGRDKTVRIVGAERGELEQTYANHGGPVFAAAFVGDGQRVVSAGRDRGLHLWQAADAKKIAQSPPTAADVLCLAVVDDAIFAGLSNGEIVEHRIFDKKLERVRVLGTHGDALGAMAVHVRTRRLASSGYDGRIRVWDLETGKLVTEFSAVP